MSSRGLGSTPAPTHECAHARAHACPSQPPTPPPTTPHPTAPTAPAALHCTDLHRGRHHFLAGRHARLGLLLALDYLLLHLLARGHHGGRSREAEQLLRQRQVPLFFVVCATRACARLCQTQIRGVRCSLRNMVGAMTTARAGTITHAAMERKSAVHRNTPKVNRKVWLGPSLNFIIGSLKISAW
jgi:hypothetical protein